MKKAILIIFALILLCCCCTITFAGLVGHFEVNGKCSYKGPLASVATGPCANSTITNTTANTTNPNTVTPQPDNTVVTPNTNTNTNQGTTITSGSLKTYTTDEYSFSYPSNWVLEDKGNGLIFVYQQDPNTIPQGQFINNIVVTSENISGTEVEGYTCDQYANSYVLPATKQTYDATLKSVNEITLNGKRTCVVNMGGLNPDGHDIGQNHYGVFSNGKVYYFTISFEQSTGDIQDFIDAANSFTVK